MKNGFKFLGYIGTCFGLLFLILALFAFLGHSFKIVYNIETIFYPFSSLLIPFLFVGICSLIIGVTALSVTYVPSVEGKKQKQKEVSLVQVEKPEIKEEKLKPEPLIIEEKLKPETYYRPVSRRVEPTYGVNLRLLGFALVSFGSLLLVGAAFAYTLEQTQTQYVGIPPYQIPITTTTRPYRDYTIPLILASIAMFVPGLALIVYRPQPSAPLSSSFSMICVNCGNEIPIAAAYCPICGAKQPEGEKKES